jgi:hypothetical protein
MSDMTKTAQTEVDKLGKSLESPFEDISLSGSTVSASAGPISGENATSRQAIANEVASAVEAAISKMSFNIPIYLSGKKIEQQLVTSLAHNNVISGGR